MGDSYKSGDKLPAKFLYNKDLQSDWSIHKKIKQ